MMDNAVQLVTLSSVEDLKNLELKCTSQGYCVFTDYDLATSSFPLLVALIVDKRVCSVDIKPTKMVKI